MQTDCIRIRRRVTRRLFRIQAVWHSDNIFTNFEGLWSVLKFVADEKFSRRHLCGRINVKCHALPPPRQKRQPQTNERLVTVFICSCISSSAVVPVYITKHFSEYISKGNRRIGTSIVQIKHTYSALLFPCIIISKIYHIRKSEGA